MRRILLLAPIPAVMAAAASAALACTPQLRSFAMTPPAAVAGAKASAIGQGVAPGGPVEVRWNSLDGGVIGTARADEKGRFKAEVTIPAAVPGVYSVVFKAGDNSTTAGVGRLPFEIRPEGALASAGSEPSSWTETRRSASPGDGEPALAVGAALAGVGAVALAGGSTVAVLRRNRRRAT